MKRRILPIMLLLAACGTPQQRCIDRETRDLRILDRLIGETEANLQRGFAFETVTVYRRELTTCLEPVTIDGATRIAPRPCFDTVRDTERRPRAIDLAAEARKLDGMQARRRDLARAALPGIAACKTTFPD